MEKERVIHILIIAWLIFVFVAYHWQYLTLARTFLDVYAPRYLPFLVPLLPRLIP